MGSSLDVKDTSCYIPVYENSMRFSASQLEEEMFVFLRFPFTLTPRALGFLQDD